MPAGQVVTPAPRPQASESSAPATPAVVALLEQAREAEGKGRLDLSEANLERAVRIESRNPMIWHRLALIKLFRQQYAEAVAMAQRSNALARGGPRCNGTTGGSSPRRKRRGAGSPRPRRRRHGRGDWHPEGGGAGSTARGAVSRPRGAVAPGLTGGRRRR